MQTLELKAVVWTLERWLDESVNIVSDSLYVVGIVQRIEDSMIKRVSNERLGELLLQLRRAVKLRRCEYSIIHIRSHKYDRGLGEGNARADKLVSLTAPVPTFVKARESHAQFHQNVKGLVKGFNIPYAEARAIVQACPNCSYVNKGLGLGAGVNPKGLASNEIWQMDVTHVAEFGRLKYVHVTIDTYSHMIWATAQSGEKAKDVKKHLLACFAVMGVPHTIKTDNGPAYASLGVREFLQLWDVKHITGIPHSPTGQAVIERANQTLKQYLQKYKRGQEGDPTSRLNKVLFVLNSLCIFGSEEVPPVVKHQTQTALRPVKMRVIYRDQQTGEWKGPVDVQFIGRGYFCVSTAEGPQWIPSRWVKPAPTEATSQEQENDG